MLNKWLYGLFVVFCLLPIKVQAQQNEYSVVLGEMETKYAFRGEKASRALNVELAASKIDKLIIKPLETVSYNTIIGPRTFSNGFKKAPVIINGELEDGIGGGVCQVSGTFHAASFLAGLEIVESTQHSRRSTYIEPGLDSTVAWPTKDLKIKNPYNFPIKIVVSVYRDMNIKRGVLNIRIYGKEKIYDVEHQTIVHYQSKVTTVKIMLPDKPKSFRHVVEVGTPAMDITRIRRIYRHKTKELILEEEKKIWYNASKRIIELGVL